jgi:hypothetical protein
MHSDLTWVALAEIGVQAPPLDAAFLNRLIDSMTSQGTLPLRLLRPIPACSPLFPATIRTTGRNSGFGKSLNTGCPSLFASSWDSITAAGRSADGVLTNTSWHS